MYWQPTDDVYNAAVSSIMTRNRFEEIMQNLHLANNDDLDKNDKFAKVRPLINLLNKQCLKHFFSGTAHQCRRVNGSILWQAWS